MAQFESYLEKRKQDKEMEYRWDQEERGIQEQKFQFGMDAGELLDYFQERLDRTSFKERTSYYFKNAGLLANKSIRYRNIAEGKANADEFAALHQNYSADKRKKSAVKASQAFGKASVLAEKYEKKPAKDEYDLYTRREEIMRLRMEGMLAAAETKSTSSENEDYLKSKAKISCLVILYDQLVNLKIQAEKKGDPKIVQKLEKKRKSIKKELDKVQKDMRENYRRTDSVWKAANDIPDMVSEGAVFGARMRHGIGDISDEDLKTKMSYQTIRAHMKKYKMDPPCHVVRLDKKGQPVSLVDAKKKEWNDRYQKAVEDGNQEQIDRMHIETLQRIEEYELPTLNMLSNYDMNTLFRNHPAEYVEMFLNMPAFIEEQGKEEGVVKQYIQEHPVLEKKIAVMKILQGYMMKSLKASHIDIQNGGFLKFGSNMNNWDMQYYGQSLQKAYQGLYDERVKEQREKEKNEPKVQTAAEKKAEFDALRRENSTFTKDNYKIYKGFREANKVLVDPGYQKINQDFLKKWNADHKTNWTDDVSRTFGAMLRAVHLDKDGKPIHEIDEKRKAQNDRWMNAWVEKEDETEEEKAERERVKEEIIQKEAKTIFKGFDFPEPEDLMKWIKETLQKKPFAFCEMLKRALAVDKLAQISPVMKNYRDNDPVFQKKLEVVAAINRMMPTVTRAYYGISMTSAEGAEVVSEERQREAKQTFEDKSNGESDLEAFVQGYAEKYNPLRPLLLKEKQDKADAAQKAVDDRKRKKAAYLQNKVNANGE